MLGARAYRLQQFRFSMPQSGQEGLNLWSLLAIVASNAVNLPMIFRDSDINEFHAIQQRTTIRHKQLTAELIWMPTEMA
jgi:hypothetical protein